MVSAAASPKNIRARDPTPPKAVAISGANSTMPSVEPAERTNEAEIAQGGSRPTKVTRHAPSAFSDEFRRSVHRDNSPEKAMSAARSTDTGMPVNAI